MSSLHNTYVSASWINLIAETANNFNLDSQAFLSDSGISPKDIADPKLRIDVKNALVLWSLSAKSLDGINFGLELSRHISIRHFDSVGCSILSSETVKNACKTMIKYRDIICNGVTHNIEKHNGGYKLSFELSNVEFRYSEQVIDAIMSCTLELTRWLCHTNIIPIKVNIKHKPCGPYEKYEEIFKCPIEFISDENSIIFSESDFHQSLPTANPMISDLYQGINQQTLNQFQREQGTNNLSAKVRQKITSELANGEPSINNIAKFFNMSQRTFQRRLKQEDWCFIDLLDDTRKNLAIHYLDRNTFSLIEISFFLGYSDSNILSRAFKRWYGDTPTKFIAASKTKQLEL